MTATTPTRSATQKDVAKALGLSQATVSRALRNLANVPAPLRRRILATARKLGYRANASATTLSYARFARHAKPIQAELAWLNVRATPEELRANPFFDLCWRGASAQARKLGYQLEEFSLHEIGSLKRLEQILLARGIEGILLPPKGLSRWDCHDFQWDRFCTVRMSRTVTEPRVHLVTTNQVANAIQAFQEMRARGYERIGFFMIEHGSLPLRRHFAYGYLGAQMEMPPSQRLAIFDCPSQSARDLFCPREDAQDLFERWLIRERPDAILTDWGIGDMVRKAGYRIPEEIGLAHTSVSAGETNAGIFENPREIGRASVNLLASLIHDQDRGIPSIFHQVLIEGNWVDGITLPQRK